MHAASREDRPTTPLSPETAPIHARGLGHRYGDRVALDDVGFTVGAGEVFGVLGPNGGGKSTLFRILSTLMPPGEGDLRLFGRDARRERDAVRRDMGVVFQSPSLDPFLTTGENLRHQGHLYGLRGKALSLRMDELLERFSLADRRGERVSRLSGGLRRRVEIAKSLLHRPRLLILDEPSTGLDPGARREMWKHLRELAAESGVTVVFTTHFMDEADGSDRVAVLDRGRLIAVEAPEMLKREVGGDVLTIETADPGLLAAEITRRFGTAAVELDGRVRLERARGHEFIPALVEAFPGRLRSISVGQPTLEDVFIHLTGRRLEEDGSGDVRESPAGMPAAGRRGLR